MLLALLAAWPALGAEPARDALAQEFQDLAAALARSPAGMNALVNSGDDGTRLQGEVHALLAQPFDRLAAHLRQPREWCQIALLHLNVKACIHERADARGQEWVTLWSGPKSVAGVDAARPLRLAYDTPAASAGRLDIELTADDGPLQTHDYRVSLAAMPAPGGSYLRLRYSFRPSALSRLATSAYLATGGRGKVGFSSVGGGAAGSTDLVDGERGIAERNVARYLFAIQAYLEGLELAPPALRQVQMLSRWFELTERFPRQLHEVERADYLLDKQQAFEAQRLRQQAVDAGGPAP